jgi:hypothetical protein
MIWNGKSETRPQASGSRCNIVSKIALYSLTVFLTYSVVATTLPFANAQEQIAGDADKARPLTSKELSSIYEDRTLTWQGGAAYFRAANHRFMAWLDKKAFGEGSWSANDNGRLCQNATWHGIGGQSVTNSSCFEHRTDDKNIYKRELPDGRWYIFSHLPAQPGDEVQALQLGNRISEGYQKTRSYVIEHKDQISPDAEKARPLTAKELNSIYEDHTLTWRGGAAYFRTSNHRFVAWLDRKAFAEGSWSANDNGRLCQNARWHGRGGRSVTNSLCFEHRTDDKNIYKRELPDGRWYIFSHLPAQSDDEIQKLQSGDHISEGYQRTRRYLAGAGHGSNRK